MKIFKKTWVAAVFLLALVFTGAENQAVASVDTMATGVVITKDQNLNVREAASSTSKIIGSVAKGSTVNIYNRSNEFYKIQYNGRVGYVHADYINATYKVIKNSAVGFINDKAKVINYRSNPETQAKALGVITKDQQVSITGTVGTWYQIKINNVFAYVPKENVTIGVKEPVITAYSAKGTATSKVIVYASQNTTAKQLGSIAKGSDVTITGKSDVFYEVKYGNSKGYIAIQPIDVHPSKKTSYVATGTVLEKANAYASPSTSSSVLATAAKGTYVSMITKAGNWYEVKLTNGKTGWIQTSKLAYAGISTKGVVKIDGLSLVITRHYSHSQLDALIKQYKSDNGFYVMSDIANEVVKFVATTIAIPVKTVAYAFGVSQAVGGQVTDIKLNITPFDRAGEKSVRQKIEKAKENGSGVTITTTVKPGFSLSLCKYSTSVKTQTK